MNSSFKKPDTEKKESSPVGSEIILIVDDELAIVKVVKQMLQRLGYKVISFTNSLDALENFRVNPEKFDAVITDLTMPNMAGDKLSIELLKIRPDIPILLCTGYNERINKEKAALIGIKDILLKPIVQSKLSQTMRTLIDKN